MDMIDLGLLVPVGIEDSKVDDPETIQFGVVVDAIDHSNAFDNTVGIAGILLSDPVDLEGEILVEDGVVKQKVSVLAPLYDEFGFFPNQSRSESRMFQKPIHAVFIQTFDVFRQVGAGVVDLRGHEELFVSLRGGFHTMETMIRCLHGMMVLESEEVLKYMELKST